MSERNFPFNFVLRECYDKTDRKEDKMKLMILLSPRSPHTLSVFNKILLEPKCLL